MYKPVLMDSNIDERAENRRRCGRLRSSSFQPSDPRARSPFRAAAARAVRLDVASGLFKLADHIVEWARRCRARRRRQLSVALHLGRRREKPRAYRIRHTRISSSAFWRRRAIRVNARIVEAPPPSQERGEIRALLAARAPTRRTFRTSAACKFAVFLAVLHYILCGCGVDPATWERTYKPY